MSKVNDWLEGILSKNTRKSYRNGIRKFEEFYGKGIETLIDSEDAGKVIEKFFVWLKGRGYTQNTARNFVNASIQFLKFFNTPVKYRKSLGIYKSVLTTRDHMLTVDEAREMFKVGDLSEKVMVKTWLLGLRVSDACRLKWSDFDVKPQNEPIELLIYTKKEDIIAHCFIDSEFQKLLAKHIPNLDKNNKYLFQSEKGGRLSEKQLLRRLQALQKRAQIKVRGCFGWHIGRKLFLRTCAELGVNQWSAKMMVGKSVPQDIATYINGVSLKKDALKVSNVLRMKTQAPIEDTLNLRNALRHVEKENTILKTRIDEIQKDLAKIKETVKQLYPKQATRHIMTEDGSIKSWTEEFTNPEEYIESTKNFIKLVKKKQRK